MATRLTTESSGDTEKLLLLRKNIIKHLQKSVNVGDTWYLVDPLWYNQFENYFSIDVRSWICIDDSSPSNKEIIDRLKDPNTHPGPIDCSSLLNGDNIRPAMSEPQDYVLVPLEAWDLMVGHFGIVTNQTPIARKVIQHGTFIKHCKVEVYLIQLKLSQYSHSDNIFLRSFSRATTIGQLATEMKKLFSVKSSSAIRLWMSDPCSMSSLSYEQLTSFDKTIGECSLCPDQSIIIEIKNEDGTWPRPDTVVTPAAAAAAAAEKRATVTTTTMATRGQYNYSHNQSPHDSATLTTYTPGVCGLSNLGNTCFMNSIIQMLSNTPPIVEYFANGNYVEDMNEDNPLGMKGEIARAFGELIKSMWSGRHNHLMPRNFKMAVGRFAPQFSGYQQHDSQELLTFLLDGLHEDLNRVRQKPYIELRDSDNRRDEEVALEAWENYKKRNDSVILDLFHGLLKSTVVCPECPKVSVTFDPVCYLSLPMPVKKERQIEIFLVYDSATKCPAQFKVTVPKSGTVRDLCVALSSLTEEDHSVVPPDHMVVTDVYGHRFHKIFSLDDNLQNILDRDDIFVYEVPVSTSLLNMPSSLPASNSETNEKLLLLPVYHRERSSAAVSGSYSLSALFGHPFLVHIPSSGLTYDQLYQKMLASLVRLVIGQENCKDSSDEHASSCLNNGATTPDNISTSSKSDDIEMMESVSTESGYIFDINAVNNFGNTIVTHLAENADSDPNAIIRLSFNQTLALDWSSSTKEQFYDDKAAENVTQHVSFHAKPNPKRMTIKLDDCLQLYTSEEKLGENDAWYCPKCKKHQEATKKFDLWSLPSILVISFKRFSYNRYWRDKIDACVDFPVRGLDMAPYIINKNHGEALYDLIAVSNHYGAMGGGHYTAYGKNKDNDKWYYFDDSNVSAASENSVVSKAAYVLFYMRRESTRRSTRHQVIASSVSSSQCNGSRFSGNLNGVINGPGYDVESLTDMDCN